MKLTLPKQTAELLKQFCHVMEESERRLIKQKKQEKDDE
jgi:hypothetical protein